MSRPASDRGGARHSVDQSRDPEQHHPDQRVGERPRRTGRRLRIAIAVAGVLGTAVGVGLSPAGAHALHSGDSTASAPADAATHIHSWGRAWAAAPKAKPAPKHAASAHRPAAAKPAPHRQTAAKPAAPAPKAQAQPRTTVCPSVNVSPTLVPSCGAWWGAATKSQTYAGYTNLERVIGRKLDITYHYRSVAAAAPSKSDLQLTTQGRVLHIDLEPRGQSWAGIANGSVDASLRKGAAAIKAIHSPVFMTFDAEADRSNAGAPAQFVAAWRHIHDVYANAGASNALWVWNVTGYLGHAAMFPKLWPGTNYVDWISWDPYNWAGCQSGKAPNPAKSESFGQIVSRFYNWVRTDGAKAGIDANKPYLIGETSSAFFPSDPALTTKWFEGIPAGLQQYPNIKAVQIWDSTFGGSCNFSVSQNAASMAGYKAAGQNPWVKIPH